MNLFRNVVEKILDFRQNYAILKTINHYYDYYQIQKRMKKYIIALMALVCTTASAGDGFYIGGGAAYQFVPLLDGTTNHSFAPAAEIGYNCGSFGIGAMGSFDGDIMLSVDVNSNFWMTDEFNVILGCGYGAIYRTTKCNVDDCDYKISGFIGWPHVNLGVEVAMTDNLSLRLIGAVGYCRNQHSDYDHRYYDYDFATHTYYSYDGWRFASQVRATIVWSF